MRNITLAVLLFFITLVYTNAQSVLVPGGTAGIGNNTKDSSVVIDAGTLNNITLDVKNDGIIKAGSAALYSGWQSNLGFNWAYYKVKNESVRERFISEGAPGAGFVFWQRYVDPLMVGALQYRVTNYGSTSPDMPIDVGRVNVPFTVLQNGLFVIGDFPTGSAASCLTNPGKLKLLVSGRIGAQEVRVSTKTWCDYVLDASYPLRPIKELEQYILLHKHLPEVPSEKEVVENGLDLAEMQKIQMKKIEELTLYIIELQKQNEKMAAEIEELKKR